MRKLGLGLLLWIAFRMAFAQSAPDSELLAAINRIKAVDNHTHVAKVVGPGEKDDDYDALPCYLLQPSPDPAMGRADNPLFLAAWQKLYGYKYSDGSAEHVGELLAGKERIKREQGDRYPAWVLDNLGTEYMVANRVALDIVQSIRAAKRQCHARRAIAERPPAASTVRAARRARTARGRSPRQWRSGRRVRRSPSGRALRETRRCPAG